MSRVVKLLERLLDRNRTGAVLKCLQWIYPIFRRFCIWIRSHSHYFPMLVDSNFGRYEHSTETSFRRFIDHSLAKKVSRTFSGLSTCKENLMKLLSGDSMTMVVAGLHPMYDISKQDRKKMGLPPREKKFTTDSYVNSDPPSVARDALPPQLRQGQSVEILHDRIWVNATVARECVETTLWLETSRGIFTASKIYYKRRAWLGSGMGSFVYTAYTDSDYPKPGKQVFYKSNYYSKTYVPALLTKIERKPTGNYKVRCWYRYTFTKKIVHRSKMRAVLTRQQLKEQERINREFKQKQRANRIAMTCPFQDTINMHKSSKWERGASHSVLQQSENILCKLRVIVKRQTEISFMEELNKKRPWKDLWIYVEEDRELRHLDTQINQLPKSVIAPMPENLSIHSSISKVPLETLAHGYISQLTKEIEDVKFEGSKDLMTPNESDKVDFFQKNILQKFDYIWKAKPYILGAKGYISNAHNRCQERIEMQLKSLADSFNKNNFPPEDDQGFDRLNCAVQSLDTFRRCCGTNELKKIAHTKFEGAKTSIIDCITSMKNTVFREIRTGIGSEPSDAQVSKWASDLLKFVHIQMRVSYVKDAAMRACTDCLDKVKKERGAATFARLYEDVKNFQHDMVQVLLKYPHFKGHAISEINAGVNRYFDDNLF